MSDVDVTFFMIVTNYDAVIADFAIRSFGKLRGVPFRLVVYPNNLAPGIQEHHFPRWRAYPYVSVLEDRAQRRELFLEGPYEHCCSIWDRELRRIATRYVACVDADFEILDGRFIDAMLAELDRQPQVIGISTDYMPTDAAVHQDSHSGWWIRLHERWHTWCIIYKREAFACKVSMGMHREHRPESDHFEFWDSTGWFQHALREQHGYELQVLDKRWRSAYVHYGAFSKNTAITPANVNLFRGINILRRRGLLGRGDLAGRALGWLIARALFGSTRATRGRLLPGYAYQWPEGVDTYP